MRHAETNHKDIGDLLRVEVRRDVKHRLELAQRFLLQRQTASTATEHVNALCQHIMS